jgi:GntR family transcriptional regulator, galactonate operon transcriptional repressor
MDRKKMLRKASPDVIDKRLYPSAVLHGQVAHEIGRRIVSGGIPEGGTLPREEELSRHFAVSRQAVREALKVLTAKGLVNSRRRAGTHVMSRETWNLLDPDVLAWHEPDALTPEFLNDLVEIRRLIEPAAAAFAAERGNPSHVARIGAALEEMRGANGDPDRFFAADVEFHLAIFSASGNTLIDRLSTILGPLLEASFRLQSGAAGSPQEFVAVHETVYQAIVGADPEGARRSMERLLMGVTEHIAQIALGRKEKKGANPAD